MNTPESDMEQMKFAREWVRAHAEELQRISSGIR